MTLLTHSKEKIPIKGCLHATITHDEHSTTGSFVVVKADAVLLGIDLFVALHMCIEGRKVVTATSPKESPTVQRAPAVSNTTPQTAPETQVQETGCAKGFVHKIQLKPDAVPVQQKLRRLLGRRGLMSSKSCRKRAS